MKLITAGLLLCTGTWLNAAVIYTQNFEVGGAPAEWSGNGSIQSTEGFGALGLGEWHLRNTSGGTPVMTLSLSGLAPHSTLTISFALALWDSLDFAVAPDIFELLVDGTAAVNQPFGNYFAPGPSCPDGGCVGGPGTLISPEPTDFASPDFGYSFFRDSLREVTITVPHSASTANISFRASSLSDIGDESFGIDNVQIQSDAQNGPAPIPEPSTLGLAALGLAAAFAARSRK